MAYQFNPFTGNFDSVGQPIAALNVKGSAADVASLPAGATTGDVYLVQADAHFYVWDGAGWDDLGTLQGPAGPAGANGANGANGADGANGVDGKTILNGAGVPSSGLGSDGDFYLDTSATAIYGPKASGSWGSPTSLIGPQGPAGAQGSPGPAGADGAAGANGDSAYDVAVSNGFVGTESQWLASLVGAQGPQGDPGPAGPQGAGLALQGTVPTVGDLPGSSTVGYGYIVVATGDLYVWNGSSWVNAGPIQGPQGDAGPAGPAGANGADGADGKTILSGTGAPGSGLGADGDFYIDTAASEIYGPKTGGAWGSGTSLIGPQGPAGANGADGANGSNGADGKTILNGTGAPGSGLGVDGDFYIDTAADEIYGPKTAGAWGSGTSLIGPTGATGPAGANGANGADGVDGRTVLNGVGAPSSGLGADGDFYVDTAAADIYGPKTAGVWGAGTSLIGPAGADGADGADGVGVPVGGTTGQVLTKSSGTDYDADWSDLPARTTSAAGVLPATSYTAITYAATVNLDLAALDGQYRTISLTGDLTLTTSNRATGRTTVIRIIADASQRTLTFPTDWKFLGTKPANIAASKTGVLSLTFFGTADSDCVAAWGVQG